MDIRTRLALQIAACLGSAAACVATLVSPRWFELLFDSAPDAGDGSLETWFAVALGVLACLTFARLSWRTWSVWRRRTQQVDGGGLS